MRSIDVIGLKFGRLVVLETWTEPNPHKNAPNGTRKFAKCICDCGNFAERVAVGKLKAGHTTSCGCYKRERTSEIHTTHGMKGTYIHNSWAAMKSRCYNENDGKYYRYGARGITVCNEWRFDFMAFYNWSMANGYSEELTIDRRNNDIGYSPENCRWTDYTTQARNRGSNVTVEYQGKKLCLQEWSEELGISWGVLRYRIVDRKWTAERAFTTPVRVFKSGNASRLLKPPNAVKQ